MDRLTDRLGRKLSKNAKSHYRCNRTTLTDGTRTV